MGAKVWNDLPNKIKNSITLTEFKNQIKNGKDQSVFAICAQDCYRMQLVQNSLKYIFICGHVLFHNDVPKCFNQIYSLLLLVIEYSGVNSFLLIFFFQMYIADFK